ncbi:MAG: hypothetical protein KF780_10405 [Sphingomonas sp.]|nr:hypothetical protein [Sphingomonas sp.]
MRIIVALVMLFAMFPAAAQTPPPPSERMAPFAALVGDWHGSGWIVTPQGRRAEVRSRETVTARLSGNALLVEGRHFEAGQPDRLVHDAMAMIVWDAPTGAYRMRSALASGLNGDFAIEPRGETIAWAMDTPGGRIDYLITISGDTWIEHGTLTAPDGRQIAFMELRLTRQ